MTHLARTNFAPKSFALAVFVLVGLLAVGCSDTNLGADPRQTTTPQTGSPTSSEAGTGAPVEVTRVVDGDSVELLVNGKQTEARLVGVNAPELYNNNDELTCAGVTAKELLEALLAAGPVSVQGDETDRFGRRLVRLQANSVDVATELVSAGWGVASDDRSSAEHGLMLNAAADRLGMWGPAGCGEPGFSGLAIVDTQVNPPGSDRDNLNEEWVQLGNAGIEPVDLAGWILRDKTTGHQYQFASLVLAPDETVTVRSGVGINSPTDVYFGETFPVWSNTDEVILLQDPQGVLVDWLFL